MDYKNLIFALVKPPAKMVSTKKLLSSSEFKDFLGEAIEKGLLLYYASVEKRGGKEYAIQPWTLERKSIPKSEPSISYYKIDEEDYKQPSSQPTVAKKPKSESDGLTCKCGKKCSSRSGLSLHQKNCKSCQ